jgi:hypothetical protein
VVRVRVKVRVRVRVRVSEPPPLGPPVHADALAHEEIGGAALTAGLAVAAC